MSIVNLTDSNEVGSAAMQNGDFLTFDGLANNKFALIMPSLPNVQFFVQKFSMPSVSVREVTLNTPYVDYNEIGEKMDFQPFSVSFLVDKYSRNWASVFNWMKEMTVQGSNVGRTDDMYLMVDNQPTIRFYGAWPTNLSGYEFDSTVEGLIYVKATLTINYDYFDYIGQFSTTDSEYK